MTKWVKVSRKWTETCGVSRQGWHVIGEPDVVHFKLVRMDDYGSRGIMYKVEGHEGWEWVVWSIRGVEVYEDDGSWYTQA